MNFWIEALFTNALGLRLPWVVLHVKFDTGKRRIDFEIDRGDAHLMRRACGPLRRRMLERTHRPWRHPDFFQFEAWLHYDVPGLTRACRLLHDNPGGSTIGGVCPGFTAFEALALWLCRELSVREAALLPRCADKQLWPPLAFCIE